MRAFVVVTALSLCLAGCASRVAAPDDVTAAAGGSAPTATATVPRPQAETAPRTPTPTRPTVAEIGESVSFRDGSTAGTIMLKRIERIPAGQAGKADARPTHGSYLVAHFRLGITHGSGVASALTFQAQTSDGEVYPAATGVVQEPLNGRKTLIPGGEHVRGDVAFDIPQGRLLISYAPQGAPVVSFRVDG